MFHRADALLQRIDDLLDVFCSRQRVEFAGLVSYEPGGARGLELGET
eukprot:gene1786-4671_t